MPLISPRKRTGQLFDLGLVRVTMAASAFLESIPEQPETYLNRHASGDWGVIDDPDEDDDEDEDDEPQEAINRAAIEQGNGVIHGAYRLPNNVLIWVMTTIVPGVSTITCLMLPEEY
jgi:hypothetical protein